MKTLLRSLLLSLSFLIIIVFANAQVTVRLTAKIAPPALPVYQQPPCPTNGYLWEPGYWDYATEMDDYFWVPGVWVAPPSTGAYWTPGYWGYDGTTYTFYTGYWGPHVGFYGHVNYGFGYSGEGFGGGEWRDRKFQYTAVEPPRGNGRPSFNGQGGITAEATKEELAAIDEPHAEPTRDQVAHRQAAMADGSSFSKLNNGRPVAAAMDKVKGTTFNTHGVPSATTPAARVKALMSRTGKYAPNVETSIRTIDATDGQTGEKTEETVKKEEHKEKKDEERSEKEEKKEEQRAEKRSEKMQKRQSSKPAVIPKPVKTSLPEKP